MTHPNLKAVLVLLALTALPALAQDAAPPKAAATAPKPPRKVKLKQDAAKNAKLVDLNSATKDELKALPGITDAFADKIIAARPFLTKARLASQNVIPRATYEAIKDRVVARQGSVKQ